VMQGSDERELAYHFGVNLVAETYLGAQLFVGGTPRA
jgi:hypothetical protein